MPSLEWKKQTSRGEAASLLRRVADAIDSDSSMRLEEGGWEIELDAPDELEVEVEVEMANGETEVEIELSWGGAPDEASESD